MNNLKKAKLIKRHEQENTAQTPPNTARPAGKIQTSVQESVDVVKTWMREKQTTQQASARQMFASLFAQPQPE